MNLENFKSFFTNDHLLVIVITFIIVFIIQKAKNKIFSNAIKRVRSTAPKGYKKKITYLKLTNHIINYIVIIIFILFVLQLLGFNVNSIIAGVGVLSVIIGLSLQDALKDIIMGFNIIVDDYFSVGDILKLDDFEGEVIELGVKSTKLKDVNNENVLVIANRNIMQALKLSDQLVVDIPLPYEENTTYMEEIIDTIISEIKNIENVKDAKYVGINEFADSAVIYRLLLYCSPEHKLFVKRSALRIIKLELDNRNITIPYTQIDIHQK